MGPARHEGLEWIVDGDNGQTSVLAEPPQVGWLAAIPAVIDQDLDGVKAGGGGQLKDAGDSVGVE
jgi:hypothetical protein